jgi:glycerate dehydrogenase
MMRATVLDGFTVNPGDNPWTSVERHCQLDVYDRTPTDMVVERARNARILLTNKTPLTRDTILGLPDLRFISVLATGYNVVDIDAARERGIPVSNVPAYGTDSVAQHVMAVILCRTHRPWEHSVAVHNGEWEQSHDFCFWLSPISELTDKTMGIVGFGRIGRRVAELASAFGMNVLAHTPTIAGKIRIDSERFDFCSLPQVFRESDYVSLHCPLTESNAGFVNADLLGIMKPGAVLINTARGGLIQEADLASSLNSGGIGGACLDVVSREPMSADNPLLKARNCIITAHIARATLEARQRLMRTTADNIEAFVNGRPINVVNGVDALPIFDR